MKVLLNLAHVRPHSGTGVYAEGLAAALEALGVEVERAAPRRPHRYTDLARAAAWAARIAAKARGADVVHHVLPARAPTSTPQVITVHDVAFVRVPECFNRRYRIQAGLRHRRAALAAGAIIVPSDATRADVRSRWRRDAVVAPHGPGQAPRHDRGEPRHFLYVGDDEPRKNLARLRAAHEQAATGLDLVVVGRGNREIAAAELDELHRHAAALVIPSLHEGFGLTALEAMHAGTPVIAARTAGLAELCEGAARFVDPRDTASIAAALTEVATVPPLREELRRRGLARAAEYSWERCARAHVDAYSLAARR